MGLHSLPKNRATEPTLSVRAFERRCRTLAVSEALDQKTGQVLFNPEVRSDIAIMSLGGRASEVIARNRGSSHRVLPFCALSNDVRAWIGFRERWTRNSGEQNYRFEEAGFSLHVGREGELAKPQVLRSEWVGSRGNSFANRAGHPHWQLDILETARNRMPAAPARFDGFDEPASLVEFRQAPPADVLLGLTIERMHLASAAPWWRLPMVPIATAPADVAELDRWILGCLSYLRQEVQRCEIVPLLA
jgi:hypothetical protein